MYLHMEETLAKLTQHGHLPRNCAVEDDMSCNLSAHCLSHAVKQSVIKLPYVVKLPVIQQKHWFDLKMCSMNITKFLQILLVSTAMVSVFFRSKAKAFATNENGSNRFMERATLALEKVLDFYNHRYHTVNIDSLLGLQVTEGILRKILIDIENFDGKAEVATAKFISLIRKMFLHTKKIFEKSVPIVREDNIQVFQMFHKIISKPWQLFHPFQKLSRHNLSKPLKNYIFDGPTSDHCISLLLKDNNGYSSCNITDSCWQFETQKDVDGYTPTHQVLYFLFGLGEGCESTFNMKFLENGVNKSVQAFLHELCENILQTAEELWEDSIFLEFEKDLFMEQALVCSLAGYEDFLNERYFDVILRWQIDIGCFGTQVLKLLSKNVQ